MAQSKSWHCSAFSVTQLCRLHTPRQTNLTLNEEVLFIYELPLLNEKKQGINMLKYQSGKLLKIWRSFQKCVWETLLCCEWLWDSCPGLKRASLSTENLILSIFSNSFKSWYILRNSSQTISSPSSLCLLSFSTNHWEGLCLQEGLGVGVLQFFPLK